MNYILATGSTVIEYPYSIEKLRSDNPETSFPAVMSEEELSAWGVYPVTEEAVPAFNEATEQLEQTQPTLINGSWLAGWMLATASTEEQAKRTADKVKRVEQNIQSALKNSDYTQLSDYPGTEARKSAFRAWRQAIRDLPLQSRYPWQIEWPMPPERGNN
jgi:hypothetical protein